ncbi:MAG: GNAT family N-acetyltransferase [Pseudomonadota bacterium]
MIRQATAGDIERFHRLTTRAYEGYIAHLGRRPTPMDRDYRPVIAAGSVWVDHQMRGGIVLEAKDGKLEVYSLVVDPDHHSQGLGQRLLGFVEDRAQHCGVKVLRLCTGDTMLRNISVYQKFGFREVGREDINVTHSPTVVWMEKTIGAS